MDIWRPFNTTNPTSGAHYWFVARHHDAHDWRIGQLEIYPNGGVVGMRRYRSYEGAQRAADRLNNA